PVPKTTDACTPALPRSSAPQPPTQAPGLLNTTNHIVYALPAVNPSVCTVPVTPLSFLTSSDDDPGTTAKLGSMCTSTLSRDAALCGASAADGEAAALLLGAAAVGSGLNGACPAQ